MKIKNKKIKKERFLLYALIGITALSVVVIIMFFPSPVEEKHYVTIFEINTADDDARTFISSETGFGNEDGRWATLQLSPSYSFGLRFNNISLPENITIIDAYIQLYSIGTPGNLYPNCRIYCDNTTNAVNFSEIGVLDISGRNYTNSYVRWNDTVSYGKWINTPSILSPLKEIIEKDNLTDGNSIAFLFVSEGIFGYSATFQNYESGYPAKLIIHWKPLK